nr:CHAD domain-containing protein [Propylenella binzhouense]
MGYAFDPKVPLGDEFTRVAGEEIARARTALSGEADTDLAVHDVRQRFKKLRGLLRLARPTLGEAGRAEERRWRDAGRRLSGSRDAAVLIAVLDDLAGGGEAAAARFPMVRKRLVERRDAAIAEGAAGEHFRQTLAELDAGEAVIAGLDWPGGAKPLAEGFAQSYRAARRACRRAASEPDAETWHEWRKQAKYHWMHLRLVEAGVPLAAKRRKKAKHLADALGSDHDLAVLREVLRSCRDDVQKDEIRRLKDVVAERQSTLRARAAELGDELFGERPKDMRRLVAEGWCEATGAVRDADAAPRPEGAAQPLEDAAE